MVHSALCQRNASRRRRTWSSGSSPAKDHRRRTSSSSTSGPRSAISGRSRTPSSTPSRPGWRPSAWSPRRGRPRAGDDGSSRSRRPASSALGDWLDRPSGAPTELRDPGLLQLFFADMASDEAQTSPRRAAARDPSGEARRLPRRRRSSGARIGRGEASGRSSTGAARPCRWASGMRPRRSTSGPMSSRAEAAARSIQADRQ